MTANVQKCGNEWTSSLKHAPKSSVQIDHVKPGMVLYQKDNHTRKRQEGCYVWVINGGKRARILGEARICVKSSFDLQRQRILKLEDMLTNHLKEHSGCITDITQALSNVNYQVDVLIEQVDRKWRDSKIGWKKNRLIGLSLDDKGRKMFNMWTFTPRTRV